MSYQANNQSSSNVSLTPVEDALRTSGAGAPARCAGGDAVDRVIEKRGPAIDASAGAATEAMLARLSRGAALLDAEGRVARCNPAFARLLGFTATSEANSLDLQRLVSDDDRAQYRRAIAKAVQSGAAAPQIVMFSLQHVESSVWLKVVATRFSDQPGERRVVIELSSAADSRKRHTETLALQQRLYHAEQVAREMGERVRIDASAEMEHRVRVALTSIVGFAESLADPSLAMSARDEAIQTIRSVATGLLSTFGSSSNASREATGPDVAASHASGTSNVLNPSNPSHEESPTTAAATAPATEPARQAQPAVQAQLAAEQSSSAAASVPSPASFVQATSAVPRIAVAATSKPSDVGVVRTDQADPLRGKKFRGRVLIVEDSKDNQRLMSFLLKKLGVTVETADHGLDALDRYASSVAPADLVLLDMQMPQLDGYQTAAALRLRGYAKPIVALTAMVREGDREQCLAAGCSDYLAKPVDRRQLVAVLAAHLEPGLPEVEPSTVAAYYDPQPSVQLPSQSRSIASAEERRRLQEELPTIASTLWTCATTSPVAPSDVDVARRTLSALAERARSAGMGEIASLADEAETSIRLGADVSVIQHALGRLLRTISRDEEPGMPTSYRIAA